MGLLHGRAARDAIAADLAVPLAGGPAAFVLARVGGQVVPATALPAEQIERLARRPPPWARLPVDRPLVMGVLNVTPDSFSDDGWHGDTAGAVAHGRRLAAEGADIVDVGGESTRPGAKEVSPEVEQGRILPVIRALAEAGIVVSVDTRHAATMAAALDAGARIINDVSGLAFDPAAAAVVRARRCPVVLMHMRGTPATMQSHTDYGEVVTEVTVALGARLAASGLDPGLVAVDPGLGFAKGPGHNEALLARLPMLLNLGCHILVGASRKGFIGRLGGEREAPVRMGGSLAAALAATLGGATILRVHDVRDTVQALRVWRGIEAAA